MRIDDLLNKLEAEERGFLTRDVLAPVLRGRRVAVRIAGIVCELAVDDAAFEGWAVLRPLALDRALIVRSARLAEVTAYLRLFPAVRLIAVAQEQEREHAHWLAVAGQRGDRRVRLEQPVPVLLAEEGIQTFDTLVARFDGRLFWYERRDSRRDPALAAYLREAYAKGVAVEALRKRGLSAEERGAYLWAMLLDDEERQRDTHGRLARALAHAGGQLESYVERRDVYTVTYRVGSERCVSNIHKDDLTVLTAGICLSGRDRDFDLTSLVGVMREAVGRPIPRWRVDGDTEED